MVQSFAHLSVGMALRVGYSSRLSLRSGICGRKPGVEHEGHEEHEGSLGMELPLKRSLPSLLICIGTKKPTFVPFVFNPGFSVFSVAPW